MDCFLPLGRQEGTQGMWQHCSSERMGSWVGRKGRRGLVGCLHGCQVSSCKVGSQPMRPSGGYPLVPFSAALFSCPDEPGPCLLCYAPSNLFCLHERKLQHFVHLSQPSFSPSSISNHPTTSRDCGPVTVALRALSLVEKAERVQVCFTQRLRDQRSKGVTTLGAGGLSAQARFRG